MNDWKKRELAGILLVVTVGFLSLVAKWIYNNLTLYFLTFFMVLLTAFIAAVVVYEEFVRIRRLPVKIEPSSSEDLGEEEDFAFKVENRTGSRISGGSEVIVMPRNLTAHGESVNLPRFQLNSVRGYLLGNDQALEKALQTNCPLYCQTPAAITDHWRGPWATYLPVEGGDKRKKISTDSFNAYQIIVNSLKQNVRQQIVETDQPPNLATEHQGDREDAMQLAGNWVQHRVNGVKDELIDQVDDPEFKEPETLMDCIFPRISIGDAAEVSVELRNLAEYEFENEKGEWVLVDYSRIKS